MAKGRILVKPIQMTLSHSLNQFHVFIPFPIPSIQVINCKGKQSPLNISGTTTKHPVDSAKASANIFGFGALNPRISIPMTMAFVGGEEEEEEEEEDREGGGVAM